MGGGEGQMSKHLYHFKMSIKLELVSHKCLMVEFTNHHLKNHIHGTQDFVMDKFGCSVFRD